MCIVLEITRAWALWRLGHMSRGNFDSELRVEVLTAYTSPRFLAKCLFRIWANKILKILLQ